MPYRLLFLALLAAISPAAAGQPAYRFDHIGTDRGLSQSTVTAIAQDHQGFLWIGTDDGLNRYDGHTFTVYRHALEDATTLPGSRITSLLIADNGDLWVGTMSGLALFDRATETFRVPLGAPGDPASPCTADVTTLAPDPDGSLWTGHYAGGLCNIAPDRKSARQVAIFAPNRDVVARVYALRLDAHGIPWAQVATMRGKPDPACRLDAAARRCEFRDDFMQSVPGSGNIQAEGIIPLALHVPGRENPIPLQLTSQDAFREQHLLALPDGHVWLGTETLGIIDIDTETGDATRFGPSPDVPWALSSESVRTLFQDRQGTVWIGTTAGLDWWQPPDPARFRSFRRGPPESGGLSDERVSGILESRDGAVWVATRDGLNRIAPETGRVSVFRRLDDGAYANSYWFLHEDAEGTLWVGTKRRGLLRFDQDTGRFVRVPAFNDAPILPSERNRTQIRFINSDRHGRLWLGLGTGFALRTREGVWHPFLNLTEDNPLPSSRVNVFYEDRRGRLWAGTDGGLCRLADDARVPDRIRFRCYHHDRTDPTSLGADVVWALAEDGRGRLWAATVGGGLARYDPDTDAFARLTTRDGLPNNTVYGLLADPSGALWATTNAGLARIDPASGDVSIYTTADGLPGNEFDFMAYHVGRSGTVYVGGPQGLAAFDPEEMAATGAPVPIAVTGAFVYDRRVPGLLDSGDTLRLRHDQNFFRLTFAALDFRTPERSRYRYRLAGYENEWRHTTAAAPEAAYTRVPPGRYVFELMALDAAGRPTAPMRLHVVVAPALWQTGMFKGGLAALVMGLGVLGLGLVYRRRQRETAREEAEAAELKRRVAEGRDRERVRLARELHDGPVQDLYRLGHDLDRLRLRAEEETPTTLLGARAQVTAVATNLREVLATLRPPIIPHLGLPAAVEALARRIRRRQPGLSVHLDLDAEAAQALPPDVQNAVYRVVQEALTNVTKHAGASSATITLEATDGNVALTIRDDGRGFEKPPHLLDLARADRFGLVGAAERMDVIGGGLTVETAPGHGTVVRAWVPQGSQPELPTDR